MCSNVTHRTLNSWLYYLVYTTFWFIINCNTYFRLMPFFCIHISQGSVATCLKRGGIFKHKFVANLLLSRLVKKILKIGLVKLWPRVWCIVFFWLTVYVDMLCPSHMKYNHLVNFTLQLKNAISLQQYDRSEQNLVWWCRTCVSSAPPIENVIFKIQDGGRPIHLRPVLSHRQILQFVDF